jgi:hypothetical protein
MTGTKPQLPAIDEDKDPWPAVHKRRHIEAWPAVPVNEDKDPWPAFFLMAATHLRVFVAVLPVGAALRRRASTARRHPTVANTIVLCTSVVIPLLATAIQTTGGYLKNRRMSDVRMSGAAGASSHETFPRRLAPGASSGPFRAVFAPRKR